MINMVYDLIYRNNIGALVLLRDGPSSPIEKTVHQSDHRNHHMHEDGFYGSGYNTPEGNGDSFHPRIDSKIRRHTKRYCGNNTNIALRIYYTRTNKKVDKKPIGVTKTKRNKKGTYTVSGMIKYRKYSSLFR